MSQHINSPLVLIVFPATCCHFPRHRDVQLSTAALGRRRLLAPHIQWACYQPGQQLFHVQRLTAQDTSRKPRRVIKDLIIKELFALQSGSVQLSSNIQDVCFPHPFRTSENRWKPQHGKRRTCQSGFSSSRRSCSVCRSSSIKQWVGLMTGCYYFKS